MHVSPMRFKQLSATVAAVLVASGCSTTPDYSAPASFTVSNDAVANVVQQALTRTAFATQADGQPTVDCSGETRCVVAYTVQEPVGFMNEVELMLPTRQMWKAMFTDPQFQNGTITVSGPVETLRGKETSAFFTLSCDRGAASRIDWNKVDAKTLKKLCNYTQQVELPFTGLHDPTGVAVDAAGNVYVTDDRDNRVLRLPAETNSTSFHRSRPDPVALPLNVQQPSHVAAVGGDIYVTDNSRVLKLPAGWNGTIELPFSIPVPNGVAVDNAGDVYVADGADGRVIELPAWSAKQVEVPFGADAFPSGVAVDGAGDIFVAGKSTVWKLPAAASTNSPTRLPFEGLKSPNGIAVDTACNIFVTDGLEKDQNRVLILPAGSAKQVELPFVGLNRPTGVAVDAVGNVYVADAGNNRVLELPVAAVVSAIAEIPANTPVAATKAIGVSSRCW